jgi:amino acid transporter
MGGFSNFAISFSIISILTGAVTLYGYGLEMGGPLEMTLGWPLSTVFTLAVAASMAELCSAYPTSGGMYHWAAGLGSPESITVALSSFFRSLASRPLTATCS